MLRTRNEQPSLRESVLPEICLRLPAEPERVDAWLDDDRFFAPFVLHFSSRMGRPSIPVETKHHQPRRHRGRGHGQPHREARFNVIGCHRRVSPFSRSRTRPLLTSRSIRFLGALPFLHDT